MRAARSAIVRGGEKKSGLTLSSRFYAHWSTSRSSLAVTRRPSLDGDQRFFAVVRSENFYRATQHARATLARSIGGDHAATPCGIRAANPTDILLDIDNNFAPVLQRCRNNARCYEGGQVLRLHGQPDYITLALFSEARM